MRSVLPSSLFAILLLWSSFCNAAIVAPVNVDAGDGCVLTQDIPSKQVAWACYPSSNRIVDLGNGSVIFFGGVKTADYTIIAAVLGSDDKLTLSSTIIHVGGTPTPPPIPVPPPPTPDPTPVPDTSDAYGFSKSIPILFQKNGVSNVQDATLLKLLYQTYVKALIDDGNQATPTIKTTADALDLYKKVVASPSSAKSWAVKDRYPDLPGIIFNAIQDKGLNTPKPLDATSRTQLANIFTAAAKAFSKVK